MKILINFDSVKTFKLKYKW